MENIIQWLLIVFFGPFILWAAWELIKLLPRLLAIVVYFFVHILYKPWVKKIWIKWLIYSIKYPWIKRKLRKAYEKKKSPTERLKDWTDYEISDHWAKDFWFGRKLRRYLLMNFVYDGTV